MMTCPSEKVVLNVTDWRLHLLEEHKGLPKLPEAVTCELCNEVWTVADAYNQHLKFKHDFNGQKLAEAMVAKISKKAQKEKK